jgi:hypothetical protein
MCPISAFAVCKNANVIYIKRFLYSKLNYSTGIKIIYTLLEFHQGQKTRQRLKRKEKKATLTALLTLLFPFGSCLVLLIFIPSAEE